MSSRIQVYDAKVSCRTKLHIIDSIRTKLAVRPHRYEKFRSTVFGPWLDIRTLEHDNHLINALLQHQRYIENPRIDTPFVFDIGPHTLEFGRREFCLVTGFCFGNGRFDNSKKRVSEFRNRVFPGLPTVTGYELTDLVNNPTEFDDLLDDDAVRVCLLFLLNYVFMGFELRHTVSKEMFNLVDDISAWNKFPWGQLIWKELHTRVYNHDHRVRDSHLKKIAASGLPTYTLQGFIFPFKIWLLETLPTSKIWWVKEENVIPRCVAWSDRYTFLKTDYDRLFDVGISLQTLIPCSDEMNEPWWRISLEYFHNLSKGISSPVATSKKKKTMVKRKVVSREVHVRTEVRREVHVHTDVHHSDYERLSVPELVNKISDMQCEFQSRMAVIERCVNQIKTSSTTSEVPVFHDAGAHDTPSSLTCFSKTGFSENPVDRAFLLNKISEMRLDFQTRLSTIEKYLNVASSSNVEKTANLDQDCMDIDKTEFCGDDKKSDDNHVNLGATEPMNVDLNYKTPCEDINNVDTANDQERVENQNISGKNLSEAFEQQSLEETYLENHDVQDFLLNNVDVQLDEQELFAVKSLFSLGGDEAQLHDSVDINMDEGCSTIRDEAQLHDAKRNQKLSKYVQSPYMVLPDSTQPNHKVRARKTKVKKLQKSYALTAHDGTLVPAWTENLNHAKNAPKNRVNVPKEVMQLLRFNGDDEKYFCFPWADDGNIVGNKFWECLMGIRGERRGWLSDTHLELWVLYLYHYRPADADWAICGAYLNTKILSHDLPCCIADGVTYGVPWFAKFVEKVYFPINAQDNHWVLGELHIRSGVITLYDSLPPYDVSVETRKWWIDMRRIYADMIPKLLVSAEVLDKKNIDPTSYYISFRYADNVPKQGDAYGDCGIWVMRNMYRLINNLSLEVSNPTHLGLAYREQLVEFFLKYKIPCLNPYIKKEP